MNIYVNHDGGITVTKVSEDSTPNKVCLIEGGTRSEDADDGCRSQVPGLRNR